MRWLALTAALLMLAIAAPAIGSFHESLAATVPDRLFTLAMTGTSFNGLHAPDTPVLEAYLGERVRFAVVATEAHTFHLHGHPWLLADGSFVDTFLVDLDTPHVFDVPAGGVDHHGGDWMYHCHVNAHVAQGMWGIFRVYPYTTTILPGGHGMTVELERMGVPLDDATLTVTIDGETAPAHIQPLGNGRYQVHTLLPERGALVVTAEHPEFGTSLARMSLGGASLPAPTVGMVHHHDA